MEHAARAVNRRARSRSHIVTCRAVDADRHALRLCEPSTNCDALPSSMRPRWPHRVGRCAPARFSLSLLIILASASSALAQDKGSVEHKPLPPLDNPNDPKIGAKQLFARKLLPSSQTPKVIGSYTKGCLAGGEQMPITGDTWQVMRLSRNRYWGYPGHDRAAEAALGEGAQGRRLARHPGRRHRPAARRTGAVGPRQPPDRDRCRHLADADAGSSACRARSARRCRRP